ncbi:MAG: UDP-3-O-(3-hydroxymyristoyl) N-acetylglucosamine deacetylase [Elusimicrobia bacterium ADurb.Bin231]|nr:MAG: UDP-3-O-(3-hydroxymyristoyl) N-acetylglucosamine deacetylase [Elusimicrobia bacterium ADurb.Bin231]
MAKQKTIKNEVSYSGIGLHTGNTVTITLKPAPANTGVVFLRTDLPGMPAIKADLANVISTVRGTTVGMDEKISVHTIEHLLAVLFVFGIDNIKIEINSNEPPVADGSAKYFVELIKKAQPVDLQEEKKVIRLSNPVIYRNGDVLYVANPSNRLVMSCTVVYDHPMLKTQHFETVITPELFEKEIASARTYCFDYEIETLKQHGLAKGGSLDNAIVVGEKKIHTELRFPDEFVRHKMLDILGDLSLIGYYENIEIIALKCGHKNNIAFAKKILAAVSAQKQSKVTSTVDVEPVTSASKTAISPTVWQLPEGKEIDINGIKATIPHRYPFLFIDRVVIVEECRRAVGIKNVSVGEQFFQGHFPERPIMPGVLIVESLAQSACVLFLAKPELKNKKLAYFMSINNVKFRKPVIPGDILYLDVEVVKARQTTGIIKGCAYVEGKPVTEAEFTFVLVDKPEEKSI